MKIIWGCFGFHDWIYAKYPEKPGRKCQRCGKQEKPGLQDKRWTWIEANKTEGDK